MENDLCSRGNIQFLNIKPIVNEAADILFSTKFLDFLEDLINTFENEFQKIEAARSERQTKIYEGKYKFEFEQDFSEMKQSDWLIEPLPKCLLDRRVDIGDVDPSNTKHLFNSLNSGAQGVQIDFDDGFCPHWEKVIQGHYNVYKACRGELVYNNKIFKPTEHATYIMFRQRAFNMIERNVLINGKRIPGALFDFALHIFHNGQILYNMSRGPYFYLSKIESYEETAFWDKVFTFSENYLKLPQNCIKACVLIECLTAVFQLDEILWTLRNHSAGLNCGLWDYSASFIVRLGHNKELLFPDRTKYVNMQQTFLSNYRKLIISACHRRGAPATGGMFAMIYNHPTLDKNYIKNILLDSKAAETKAGADGGLIYDIQMVPEVLNLFEKLFPPGQVNQINQSWTLNYTHQIHPKSLLEIPTVGGATIDGLKLNIEVTLLFIENWLSKVGHFILGGKIEDSATAEISRSQIWQQIRHSANFEEYLQDTHFPYKCVDLHITQKLLGEIVQTHIDKTDETFKPIRKQSLKVCSKIFWDLITQRRCPLFITSYLEDQRVLQSYL